MAPISHLTSPPPPLAVPRTRSSIVCAKIQEIALATLAELVLSLSVTLFVSQFILVPGTAAALLQIVLIQSIANGCFRFLGAAASTYSSSDFLGTMAKKVADLCHLIVCLNFSLGTALNGQILVHEAGHALAALALYQKSRPTITLFPFVGGMTHFSSATLSPLGQQVGTEGASALVTAAGPLLSLIASSGALIYSFLLDRGAPTPDTNTSPPLAERGRSELRGILKVAAIQDFATHTLYALSALRNPNSPSHDFARLWKAGLHPLPMSLATMAIPIILYQYCRSNN